MEIRQHKTAHIPILFYSLPISSIFTYVQLRSDTPCHTKLNNPSLELLPYALIFYRRMRTPLQLTIIHSVQYATIRTVSSPTCPSQQYILYLTHRSKSLISLHLHLLHICYRTILPYDRTALSAIRPPPLPSVPISRSTNQIHRPQPDSSHPTTRVSVPSVPPTPFRTSDQSDTTILPSRSHSRSIPSTETRSHRHTAFSWQHYLHLTPIP